MHETVRVSKTLRKHEYHTLYVLFCCAVNSISKLTKSLSIHIRYVSVICSFIFVIMQFIFVKFYLVFMLLFSENVVASTCDFLKLLFV